MGSFSFRSVDYFSVVERGGANRCSRLPIINKLGWLLLSAYLYSMWQSQVQNKHQRRWNYGDSNRDC